MGHDSCMSRSLSMCVRAAQLDSSSFEYHCLEPPVGQIGKYEKLQNDARALFVTFSDLFDSSDLRTFFVFVCRLRPRESWRQTSVHSGELQVTGCHKSCFSQSRCIVHCELPSWHTVAWREV